MTTDTATETLDALAPYSKLRAQIEALKAENAGMSFDYTKANGIKAARSHIYGLRTRKADIERVRKDAKAGALEYGRKVDAVAKDLTAEVEEMIAVHQGPIDEIEAREAARKAAHEANMAKLPMPEVVPDASKEIHAIMEVIGLTHISEKWEEYEAPARKLRDETLQALSDKLVAARKREADAAELERLRKEKVELERQQREEQIRRDAEAKARREAEEAAARKEREREAAARAEKERAEREQQQAIEAERAKARQAEERLDAERRAAKEAEQRREREAREKAEAEPKRKADAEHRAKIIMEAAETIAELDFGDDIYGLVHAIAEGQVPHVTVQF